MAVAARLRELRKRLNIAYRKMAFSNQRRQALIPALCGKKTSKTYEKGKCSWGGYEQ